MQVPDGNIFCYLLYHFWVKNYQKEEIRGMFLLYLFSYFYKRIPFTFIPQSINSISCIELLQLFGFERSLLKGLIYIFIVQ